jgi:catechol 2,3-dioxygenase-like lactoylglutathione lyase family enzyme
VPPVVAVIAAISFDAGDPPALAEFWRHLLGGEIVLDDDGDAGLRGGPVDIDFLLVPEAKAGKNRVHLDLRSVDLDRAVEEAVAAGATTADDVYVGSRWRVLRDPEGNEFCLLRPAAS